MINAAGKVWDLKTSRRGGKEKERTDCVQSDIQAFGIAVDWKATALKAEVWVETATEDGRRFLVAWRKEEVRGKLQTIETNWWSALFFLFVQQQQQQQHHLFIHFRLLKEELFAGTLRALYTKIYNIRTNCTTCEAEHQSTEVGFDISYVLTQRLV